MKQLLAIMYTLKKESKTNYEEVFKIIQTYDYLKIGESEYLVYTASLPSVISTKISPLLKGREKLLVITITNPKQGLFTKQDWKWINDRMS